MAILSLQQSKLQPTATNVRQPRMDVYGIRESATRISQLPDYSLEQHKRAALHACLSFGGVRESLKTMVFCDVDDDETFIFSRNETTLFQRGAQFLLLRRHTARTSTSIVLDWALLSEHRSVWVEDTTVQTRHRRRTMGDDDCSASELRRRYHMGGNLKDDNLTAPQLRARYGIKKNTAGACKSLRSALSQGRVHKLPRDRTSSGMVMPSSTCSCLEQEGGETTTTPSDGKTLTMREGFCMHSSSSNRL